ncbi:acetyl-CoA acetyltransferase [Roseomonas chloroacetimidivorans]|uniref:acetyl-CoA acetyltransferase n=1 Tax=Roseomonas chloroacetimidivorans TaxID=1766656 RepID=UPI003C7636A2
MAQTDPSRIPVIAGVGEAIDRPADPACALEPLALMEAALRAAEADAGAALLRRLDSLDVINVVSWPSTDMPGRLAERLGIAPARRVYGVLGGETPTRRIHDAALRIARGESQAAAICGGEAERSVQQARKAGMTLPWAPRDPDFKGVDRSYLHPELIRHGMVLPLALYALYESATQAHWGQTPAEGLEETGALWSDFSAIAARNPCAWSGRQLEPEEITRPGPDNRPVAWPFTKWTVAQPAVNQGAAILVTSLGEARAAGVPESRLIHIWGGAAADEPHAVLTRENFHAAPAMDVVLEAAVKLAGSRSDAFVAREFYSCFPPVPKMARRSLGLPQGTEPSVAGGLTFFGAPVNDYMAHAAAAMVRRLRESSGGPGLLYGQGGHVTKHHALVLGREPPPRPLETGDYVRQDEADRRHGPAPAIVPEYDGPARVEASTVLYGRDGAPTHGTVVARTPAGARIIARVPAADTEAIAALTELSRSPVGLEGRTTSGAEGLLAWRLA